MVPNGVQEDDVSWHQGVIWCQEGGSHGQNQPKEEHGSFRDCKKKKKTSYGFAAVRFNVSNVMITTFIKLCERNPFMVIIQCQFYWFASQAHSSTALPGRSKFSSDQAQMLWGLRSWWTAKSATPLIRRPALTSFYPHCDFLPNMEEVELLLLLPCLNEILKFRASLGNEPALPCTDL